MYRDHKKVQHDYFQPKYSKTIKSNAPLKKKEAYGDFGIYCSNLMKHSLITGFSVIAASKSTVRRTIKSLVFLICTAGFIYQTYYFLMMYLSFPIILDISVIYPEKLDLPSVTVCNRNRLFRQTYCEKFRSNCTWKYTYETLCNEFPKFCPQVKPKNPVLGTLEMRNFVNLDRSIELLNAAGPEKDDLILACLIKGIEKNVLCKMNVTSVIAAKDGKPYKCFSIMSLLGSPDANPQQISLNDEYSLVLQMKPEEYMDPLELIQAYVYVHDPRTVTNPMAEGFTLNAGRKYKLYVSMEKRESLQAPYKSNCTDYVNLWRKNGGYGPMTKRGCSEICKIDAMMKEYGCVGQTTTYPNNFTICDNNKIVSSEELNEKCSEDCNNACDVSLYSMMIEVVDDIGKSQCEDGDQHCENNLLAITISFSRTTITKYKHEPKFQSVEMFSYIGGYMGMWLGISLVSLFDFGEMLFDVLAYPVLKWKSKKKKSMKIENMRRAEIFNMYDQY